MDKNLLFSIAKNLSADSPETAEMVIASKNEFPYSQVLHVLSAKLSKEFALPHASDILNHAAIYVADRSWLKEIMEMEVDHKDVAPSVEPPPVIAPRTNAEAPTVAYISKAEIASKTEPATPKVSNEKDVAEALLKDLERLNQLKHNFEMLFVDQSAITNITPADSVNPTPVAESDSAVAEPKSRRKRKAQPQENLIEEIQITKSELAPENERQKKQIDLIDQFIKTQPSISGGKERTPSQGGDLNSFKTGEFSDNIISETLVEILVKQGKKERAIEVLKKLIWKYPQKKAYFASQIDDLKK